jgi:hypothetical protein
VKKSGWLKYALACNVSLEKIEERPETLQLPGIDEPVLVFHFDYRVLAPSGRYTEASGSASIDERESSDKVVHDTRSLAQTRAMNRVISNLVGGGETSAEEIEASSMEGSRHVASNQTKKGVGSLDELEYHLMKQIPGLDEVLTLVEMLDGFHVEKARYLEDEEWKMINGWIQALGGRWASTGRQSYWLVPRRR